MKKVVVIGVLLSLYSYNALGSNNDFFLYAEAGRSYAGCGHLCVPSVWDPAVQGYNARLNKGTIVGLGFGYIMNDIFSIGVSANRRSGFSYCKFQTPPPGTSNLPDFLGEKTRLFNVDALTYMANFYVYAPLGKCWEWLNPYIKVGLGWSDNTVYNFHSVLNTQTTIGGLTARPVASIMAPYTTTSFAWLIEVGLDFWRYKQVSIGLAYRYFSAGRFRTNNYIVDTAADFNTPITLPPWCGKLTANEIVAKFGIQF